MKKIFLLLAIFSLLSSLVLTVTLLNRGYTVNFETNGGEPQIEEIEVRHNKVVVEPTAPSKEGHTFDGWFLDVDFTQKYDFNTKVKNDFTLYAKWNVNSYTITFNSNGGTEIDAATYNYGSALSVPAEPTKTGHQFEAWYTDEALSNRFDWTSKMPANDLTLYAKWVANAYEVTFISLGVELSNLTQNVEYGNKVAEPQTIERIGYTFGGWYLDGAKYDFNTPVTQNIELSALWVINSYTFSFDTVGGSEIADVVYEYNATIVKPENPTKPGYTFAGWMSNGELYSFTNAKMPDHDVKLTAVWTVNDYVITFNKNNVAATGAVANVDAKYDVNVNIPANAFTLVGYTFKEWNTKADGTGTSYQVNQEVSKLAESGIVELFAIWEVNSYKVSFNANGGTGSMADQTLVYGVAQNLTANAFVKVGYTFDGWATSENGTVVYHDAVSYTIGAEDVTLYAVWKANTYVVSFNANGGTGSMASQTFVYDAEKGLENNSFSLIGSAFKGWATSATGEVVYTDGQKVKNLATSGEVELYAVWEKIEYTLTVSLSQSESYTFQLHYGDSIKASIDSINTDKAGQSFDGWFAFVNNEWVSVNADEFKMPANNLTIGAKYLGAVSITFIVDGNSHDVVTGFEGETITKVIEKPSKIGYNFAGWYLDEAFTKQYNLTAFPTEGDENYAEQITVYAKFTIASFTVSFVTNTTTQLDDLTLEYGSQINVTLEKTGYSLTWYTDAEFEHKANLVVPAEDITLYAEWTANEYSVVYNKNSESATGEVVTQEVKYDQTFNLSSVNYELKGYEIEKWNTQADGNGTDYALDASVKNLATEGEFTLYAVWAPISYKVSFKANGGTGSMDDQTLVYDVENQKLTAKTFDKEGHTFKGWATSATGEVVYTDGATLTENLTSVKDATVELFAVWQINTYTITFVDANGNEISKQTVNWGTLLNALSRADVEKVGHEYAWYYGDVLIDLDTNQTPITSNMTFKVVYTKLTYTVHFMVGNKPIYTVVQEYDAPLTFEKFLSDTKITLDILQDDATTEEDNRSNLDGLVFEMLSNFMLGNYGELPYNALYIVSFANTVIYDEVTVLSHLQSHAINVYAELKPLYDLLAPVVVGMMTDPEHTDYSPLYGAYDPASKLYSVISTELLTLKPLYSIYSQNDGKPKKEGYIFKGWVLGEDTLYEDKTTGDAFDNKTPAAKNPGEPAYLVALFAGVNPIEEYEVSETKLTWTAPSLEDILQDLQEDQYAEIEYEVYSYVLEANGVAKYEHIATVKTNEYTLSTDSLQPGTYQIKVITNVTIKTIEGDNIVEKLTSEFGTSFAEVTLTLSSLGDMQNLQSGDYYYYDQESEVFYFYTNMTYDFQITDFVLVDKKGEGNYEELTSSDYVKLAKNNENKNSILKIQDKVGSFYFKNGETVYLARVLPYVSSFYFGENLKQFEVYSDSEKNTSLFLNAANLVYQIGVAGTYEAADYKNGSNYNGFVFDLDVRTSGGEKIDYSLYPDFLIYSFTLSSNTTVHYLYDSETKTYVTHRYHEETRTYEKDTTLPQIGQFIDGVWYFDSSLVGEQVLANISIKQVYVPNKLLVDGKITAQTLKFELNDRANVYSHESLKAIYGNLDLKAGINIHANITAELSDTQRYTQASIDAGNPYILYNTHPHETNILDGAPVNVGMHFIRRDNNITNTFTGNVYSRVSNGGYVESNKEEYIISGNLFSIDGSNLPYANTKHCYWEDNPTIPAINLSNVAGYEIACMESAIFLYINIKGGDDNNGFSEESNGKLIINDLNIKGNTTVPQIVDSSSGEFESSLAVMNRNSGGYLGVFAPFGADSEINNTVITNTTIAVKYMAGETIANFDYFYTGQNWSNSVMGRNNGKFTFTHSVFKNSGGAALFFDDHLSNVNTGDIDCTVRVSNDTIIENYISGEEGYFKAYNLVFPVMKMKSMLNAGVEGTPGLNFTMIKNDFDEYTELTTQKVNFIFLSLPIELNTQTGGRGESRVNFEYFNALAQDYETYNYANVIPCPQSTNIIVKDVDSNSAPLHGVVLTFQTINPGQNAFMVAGAFQKGLYD